MSEEELNKHTVAELKDMCEEKGIDVPSGALKADIVNLLVEHEKMAKEVKKEKKSEKKTEETPKAGKKEAAKPKKEKKKKKSGAAAGLQKMEDTMARIGYLDVWDYLTLAAGVLGMIFTLLGFIVYLMGGTGLDIGVQGFNSAFLSTMWNNAMRDLGLYILQIWIYLNLIAFPFMIKKVGVPILKKWKAFPLHFIKTGEDLRAFIVFLGFWSSLFFWAASPSWRSIHFLCLVILTIVVLVDPLTAKWKLPKKKIQEY